MAKNFVGLELRKSITISAARERVFACFHKALANFHLLPGRPTDSDLHLVMDATTGGQIFAVWRTPSDKTKSIMLGTIVEWSEPELIRISGTFSLNNQSIMALVYFEFDAFSNSTKVSLTHQILGEQSHNLEVDWLSAWKNFLISLKELAESDRSDVPAVSVDPVIQLDRDCQDLEANLIKLRRAVAQCMAAQKMLEQQLEKRREQGLAWLKRSELAEEQNNSDLAKQARERMAGYSEAAVMISEQLEQQKLELSPLRDQLMQMEVAVGKAFTSKHILIAREKAFHAAQTADKILLGLESDTSASLDALVSKAAALALKQETLAKKNGIELEASHVGFKKLLSETTTALQSTLQSLIKLQELMVTEDSNIDSE